jgi:ubiquinone/menaquinone biosynthesis C-methylase UbiE
MKATEFDKFADEYEVIHAKNIAITGETPEFFAEYKVRDVAEAVAYEAALDAANTAILDFGAGVGNSVPFFRRHFPTARLTCLDVSSRSLALAERRFADAAEYRRFDGSTIPFEEASFDIVFAACVFHHIDHSGHVRLLGEFHRVLKPGGAAFIFEHNPLNPLTVRAVNTCPFDANARLIRAGHMAKRMRTAGFEHPLIRYRIFFPAALRWLRGLERFLTAMPLGAQYYVQGRKA